MHKISITLCLFLMVIVCSAQNKQLVYNFDQLPQTLMTNPGAVVDYKYHVGVPILSGIYFQAGFTDKKFNYNNIYDSNGLEMLRNANDIKDFSTNDYLTVNQQVEIFYGGIRLKNPRHYLSFGMYQEFNGFSLYPDDVVEIFFNGDDRDGDGIPEFDRVTDLDQLNLSGELLGILHIGLSSKINDKLNVGLRLKLISGSFNFRSTHNQGNYQLDFSENSNLYLHNFLNLNTVFSSSGLDYDTKKVLNQDNLVQGMFFGNGNIGMGVDLGITYQLTDRIKITGSVLDLDYISYNYDVVNYAFLNDFIVEDEEYFDPPYGDEKDYWQDKINDYRYYYGEDLPLDTLNISYNSYRSPIVNSSVSYVFYSEGKKDKAVFRDVNCEKCMSNYNSNTSEVGIQTYTIFRPGKIGWAVTGYYSRSFNEYLNAKVTYTYDPFSPYNIGIGLSGHFKSINIYAAMDNLLYLPRLKESNYQSIQMGINFIFK